jgi:FtsP/CotA-like multicopper oxidase with cupredoxin domain
MHRRQVLQYAAFGAAAPWLPIGPAHAQGASIRYDLTIEPVDVEMIDGVLLYMRLYYGGPLGADTPRPVLAATEGDSVTVSITNNAPQPHGFAVPGVPAATIAAIAPGQTGSVTFTAPAGGSYLYADPVNAPVNRLIGLHGAFVVSPRVGLTAGGARVPYSAFNASTQMLFEAFGSFERFPGHRWDPFDPARNKIWLFSQHDPALNAAVEAGAAIDGARVVDTFLPRYFTINGLSGFDASHDETIVIKGHVGEPTLIRTMNGGYLTHSPHIHGNHVFQLTETRADGLNTVLDNIPELDTWTLAPMARVDVLLPCEKPRDSIIWPPREEPFPMEFVMHCHTELSQTAGGGNYPQGCVTHWELEGPLQEAVVASASQLSGRR